MHHTNDVDDLLLTASKIFNYLVVGYKTNFFKFFDLLNDYWSDVSKDLTVTGHILDKKDSWYEIHHQSFLINLQWWLDVGKPVFGQEQFHNDPVQLPNVARSQDNFHDDYTPLWVSLGQGHSQYHNTKFGYNILSKALQHNIKIYPFDDKLRKSKIFYNDDLYLKNKHKFAERFKL